MKIQDDRHKSQRLTGGLTSLSSQARLAQAGATVQRDNEVENYRLNKNTNCPKTKLKHLRFCLLEMGFTTDF